MSVRPGQAPFFCEGDRVVLNGEAAVVLAVFPDGFHTLRLVKTGQLTGAHFLQLTRPQKSAPSGRANAA